MPLLKKEPINFSAAAANEWMASVASPGYTPRAIEHNSGVAQLVIKLDTLADPQVALDSMRRNDAPNPHAFGMLFDNYSGPGPNNGKRLAVLGMLPMPTEPTRMKWWKALAEVLFRLGDFTTVANLNPPTGVVQPPPDAIFIEIYGPGARAVQREHFVNPAKLIKESPDVAAKIPGFAAALQTITARLIETLATPVPAPVPSITEIQADAFVTAVAAMYDARVKRGRLIAGGVGGVLAVGTAGFDVIKKAATPW